MRTPDEIGNLLRGLAGQFVPPGPQRRPHPRHGEHPAYRTQFLFR